MVYNEFRFYVWLGELIVNDLDSLWFNGAIDGLWRDFETGW